MRVNLRPHSYKAFVSFYADDFELVKQFWLDWKELTLDWAHNWEMFSEGEYVMEFRDEDQAYTYASILGDWLEHKGRLVQVTCPITPEQKKIFYDSQTSFSDYFNPHVFEQVESRGVNNEFSCWTLPHNESMFHAAVEEFLAACRSEIVERRLSEMPDYKEVNHAEED